MIAPATAAVRRRLYELLDHGGIGDRAAALVGRLIVLLIVINLVAVTLESVLALHAEYGALFTAVEFLSLVAFTIEYGLRAWVAPVPGIPASVCGLIGQPPAGNQRILLQVQLPW